jgi:hypothetical protein
VVCRAVSCLMPKRFRMSGLSEKGVTSPPVFGTDGISRIAHGASRRSRSAVALETQSIQDHPRPRKSGSQWSRCWSKGGSNYQSHRERSGHGRGPHQPRPSREIAAYPSAISLRQHVGPGVRIPFAPAASPQTFGPVREIRVTPERSGDSHPMRSWLPTRFPVCVTMPLFLLALIRYRRGQSTAVVGEGLSGA